MYFQVDSFDNFVDMTYAKNSKWKLTNVNNKKIRVAEWWFLCTTLLYNVFYQCMRFQVDSYYCLELTTRKNQIENKQRAITQKEG